MSNFTHGLKVFLTENTINFDKDLVSFAESETDSIKNIYDKCIKSSIMNKNKTRNGSNKTINNKHKNKYDSSDDYESIISDSESETEEYKNLNSRSKLRTITPLYTKDISNEFIEMNNFNIKNKTKKSSCSINATHRSQADSG